MKKLYILFSFLSFGMIASAQSGSALPSLDSFRCVTLAGDTISLSQYHGKKLMILNVASYCQYTPQYRPLQNLYDNYNQFNFEILGFPSDDFGNQGGSDSAIAATCHSYNVTFQIMEKVACVSSDTAPIFKWLQRYDMNGVDSAHINWNFNKFLIDEAGHWVRHYESATAPDDTAIINWIMSPSVIPDTIDSTHTGIVTIGSDKLVQMTSANPTNTSIDFTINGELLQPVAITMYSMQGTVVANVLNGVPANKQLSYPVAALPSGMYLIKIQSGNGQQVIRYAVQH